MSDAMEGAGPSDPMPDASGALRAALQVESCVATLSRLDHLETLVTELGRKVDSLLDAPRPLTSAAATGPCESRGARRLVEAGDLRMDLDARRVTVAGVDVALTPVEFRLLEALVLRRDMATAREALLDQVWHRREHTHSRTIDTHVKRLRDRLGSAGDCIQTVRGFGYRFSDIPYSGPPRESRSIRRLGGRTPQPSPVPLFERRPGTDPHLEAKRLPLGPIEPAQAAASRR